MLVFLHTSRQIERASQSRFTSLSWKISRAGENRYKGIDFSRSCARIRWKANLLKYCAPGEARGKSRYWKICTYFRESERTLKSVSRISINVNVANLNGFVYTLSVVLLKSVGGWRGCRCAWQVSAKCGYWKFNRFFSLTFLRNYLRCFMVLKIDIRKAEWMEKVNLKSVFHYFSQPIFFPGIYRLIVFRGIYSSCYYNFP